jgi:hypothetical protein
MSAAVRRGAQLTLTLVATAVLTSGLLMSAAPAQAAPVPFQLRSDLNARCLDIYGANPANEAIVQMYGCTGGINQKWYWNGREIRSSLNNKCLDIYGANAGNEARVQMYDCWGGPSQHWSWKGRELLSDLNNKCLDIYGANALDGARVQMFDCWGGANQRWYPV